MTATTARLTHTGSTASFRRGMILGAVATAILWLALVAAVALANWLPTTQTPPANVPVQVVDENHPFERPDGVNVF